MERQKKDVLIRLRRIEGQLRGIQRMVEEGVSCPEILTQVAAATAALKKASMTIIQTYMEECLSKSKEDRGMKREDAIRDFQKAIARYIDWAWSECGMWIAECGIKNPRFTFKMFISLLQFNCWDIWKEEEEKMASVLKVKGMSCQHCVMSVTKALNQLEGIKNVQIDLAKGEVRFDSTKSITSDQIQKAITDAGYQVVSESS
jgi:copper ion binding protein